ncbi:MAG: leucine-rich repeat domain-containing protein [Oscillospiraceae bacterium]|nr:leucine-rich repeat domain-containing protein [Oscillospiraceae bacterium]
MKKLINRTVMAAMLALLLVLCLYTLPGKTMAATSGKLTYTVSDGKATITDCDTSVSGKFTIPSKLGGYPVTAIGDYAFTDCSRLISVQIPTGVTSIGKSAFSWCQRLSKVTIPDTVTIIGDLAFAECSSLTKAYLPNSVTYIGSEAFSRCQKLSSIKIPNSVKTIGDCAFANCFAATSLRIGSGLSAIPDSAFLNCDNLTSLSIPRNVTSIGNSAFSGCNGLTHISIPNTVTYLGKSAFYGCKYLVSVKIGNGVKIINKSTFAFCDRLKSITIGKNVTVIGEDAFRKCVKLSEVIIPEGVTQIQEKAFYGCSALKQIKIPDSLRIIGDYAFYECYELACESLGKNIVSIGDCAFTRCAQLESVVLPDGLVSIGYQAFYDCTSLTAVTVPGSVIDIGQSAFSYCDSLKSVTLGKGLKYIGNNAFSYCESLTTVIIPEGMTQIESNTFTACSRLNTVVIPQSVTTISETAFRSCIKLSKIFYAGTSTQWNNVENSQETRLLNSTLYTQYTPFYITSQPLTVRKQPGETAVFSVQVSGTGLSYQWQRRGALLGAEWSNYTGTGSKTPSIQIPVNATQDGYRYRCVITDQRGVVQYSNVAALHVPVLKVTKQPANQFKLAGAAATFTVKAAGSWVKYQWQYRSSSTAPWVNASMPGSQTHTLPIPATASRNGFQYRCKVTDEFGNVKYSKAAKLTIVVLKITASPVDRYVPIDCTATFSVKATGTGLSYQWQYYSYAYSRWVKTSVAGNKTATLRVPVTKSRNGTRYRCKVTDQYGNVQYTEQARLHVVDTKIVKQPKDKFLPAGQTATFSVTATGTELTYQWQFRQPSSSKWYNAKAAGSNTPSLSVPVTASKDGFSYRCKITDQYKNVVYSNTATLNAVTLKVTVQPVSVVLAAGETATFAVSVNGEGLQYQWQYCNPASGVWVNASATGNKTETLTVPATASRNGFQYRCVVTDHYGNVLTSDVATLTVQ